MKYIIVFLISSLLLAGCNANKVEVYPTGSFDTFGIHWMTIERDNIKYYFQGEGVNAASVYTDEHEKAYETLNPIFNAQLPQKLRFFVWTDPAQAEQLLGSPLGFTDVQECACYVRASQTLGHEMTHALTFWAGGVPSTRYARFVNEGVAVAFDLSNRDKIAMAKEALAGQNISGITEFWSGNLQAAPEELFYPVAGAFMDFLYKKNMPEKFNALLKTQRLEDAQTIYGKEQLDAFITEFNGLVGL